MIFIVAPFLPFLVSSRHSLGAVVVTKSSSAFRPEGSDVSRPRLISDCGPVLRRNLLQPRANLLLRVSQLLQQSFVIRSRVANTRVLVTVAARKLQENFRGPPHQRLRLAQPVRRFQQVGQVV